MLCGGWLMLACVQYIAGINTTYFSYFLVTTSYLAAVVLLSAWVKMWVQAGQGRLLADAVMTCVLIAGLLQAASICLQMLQLEDWLNPWLGKSSSFPRQGGFLRQPNLCASLMVSAMVCLVFLKPGEGAQSARPAPWRLVAMTDDTRPLIRRIAKENTNVFSQKMFLNLPLLKVMILDGETAIANQLAKRMCLDTPKETWVAIQIHLKSSSDPKFPTWLAQLPPDTLNCKP